MDILFNTDPLCPLLTATRPLLCQKEQDQDFIPLQGINLSRQKAQSVLLAKTSQIPPKKQRPPETRAACRVRK